jgi:hypothetical protein
MESPLKSPEETRCQREAIVLYNSRHVRRELLVVVGCGVGVDMAKTEYSALIRTFNSERTLPNTLECLYNQTVLPTQYIFVDSGSSDGTPSFFPSASIVHKFIGRDFNYSEVLNQGLYMCQRRMFSLSVRTRL